MVIKIIFRPHSPHLNVLSIYPQFFPKPLSVSLFTTKTTPAAAIAITSVAAISPTPSYGPSLKKGHHPSTIFPNSQHQQENDTPSLLNEENFTRVFDLAALRVPSEHCFALESRLRGHLLNWPRIRNIARVPGDEIDDEFKKLFNDSSNADDSDTDDDALVALNRRIYGKAEGDGELLSPVLYRDKLARTFNSKGFVKFRNLAKISRPKKGRPKKKDEGEKKGANGRNGMALVEVVQSVEEEEDCDDVSGLLGEEFKGQKRWRGSTRLLLLDETYVDNRVEDMPEAIKAVVKEYGEKNGESTIELVKCKLTLFYSYWQMNEVLEALLPEGMIVPSGFETVGHIAHLNLKEEHLPYKNLIAKVVLDKNKSKLQTVVNKVDVIQNDFRTMQLEVLAGNHSLVTTVTENGLRFHVDLATVYWNSRLSTERQRLLNYFRHEDVVCDVFAGVGPIALSAARKVKRVYANDLNPCAVDYLERNCVLNKLEKKVEVFNMDGRRFIDTIFANAKARPVTQVVMNLPNDAIEFLDVFRGIFWKHQKDRGHPLPRIHVYGFSKARDPEFDFHERIRIALSEVAFDVDMHKVRLVAPGKWMLCASFVLPEMVAYAKTEPIL